MVGISKAQKSKNKISSNILATRNAFEAVKMDHLFDITVPDVMIRIQADRLRTQEARDQNIAFLEDQRDRRIGRIDVTTGGRDIKYDKAISKKAARQARLERSTSLSSSFNSSVSVAAPAEESVEDMSDTNSNDPEFVIPESRKRKAEFVRLNLPRKTFIKETSVTTMRYQ